MNMQASAKESKFADLVGRVKACKKCPRMAASARVLSAGCGSLDAKVMFIGEAPGRLGADASELPFHGDKSGHNFESLLEQVGLSRYDAFVTNAVLCNPKDEKGNNATPSPQEINNCAPFLREQLDLVNSKVVVSLGAVALRASAIVEPHQLTLNASVRHAHAWNGRLLVPAYHPGQRAMVHRSFANQLADYQFIAETVLRADTTKSRTQKRKTSRTSAKVGAVAARLLAKQGELSYFALHKLLFLAEVRHLETTDERLTDAYFVRQKDGPYCVEFHGSRISALVPGAQTRIVRGRLLVVLARQKSLYEAPLIDVLLSEGEIRTLDHVGRKYGGLSDGDLKKVAYLASPMREMLRREKELRVNLFNSAVLPPKS
jgi:uracil-DNA glycosylase family 4